METKVNSLIAFMEKHKIEQGDKVVILSTNMPNWGVAYFAIASMGAVVGAAYALDKLSEFKEWMLTLDRFKVINLLDFTFSTQGLVKGDKVFKTMKKITREANIEDEENKEYLEKFEASLMPLNKFLELNPDDAAVWELLGKVYANLGKTEESKEAFEKADQYR